MRSSPGEGKGRACIWRLGLWLEEGVDFLEEVHFGLRVLKDFREGVLGKVFREGLGRRKFGAEFSGSPGRVEGSRLSIRFLLSSWPCVEDHAFAPARLPDLG